MLLNVTLVRVDKYYTTIWQKSIYCIIVYRNDYSLVQFWYYLLILITKESNNTKLLKIKLITSK